jgi:hypothetical protein
MKELTKEDLEAEIFGLACEVIDASEKEIVLRSLLDKTEWRFPLLPEFGDVYKRYVGQRIWLSLGLASVVDDVTLIAGAGKVQMGIQMTELELAHLTAEATAFGMSPAELLRERIAGIAATLKKKKKEAAS